MSPVQSIRLRLLSAAALATAVLPPLSLAVARAEPPTVVRPTTRTAACVGNGCHATIINRPVVHGPVARHTCQACHTELEPRLHTFRDPMPREKMCVGCHVLQHRDVTHQPVAVGDCTGCHDPHGSACKSILRADPATRLCLTCHADLGFLKKKHVHGPVAAGACILCHESHSSWNAKLLKKRAPEICANCHAEVPKSLETRRHVHAPVAEGRCAECHDPHAGDQRGQLRTDSATLCGKCHEPIRHSLASSAVVHGAATTGDGCLGCHVGHASDQPRLQRQPQPAACLTCHDKTLLDAAGRPIADMAAMLRDNPNHHGPIREGNCTACHNPHASGNFRLLSTDYPADFYAPFDPARYRLCFGCHQPEMVTSAKGTGFTQFRDGDRNLHSLHVNQEKGRTCRACHEVHASKRPFHIRDAVPFGNSNWMLEINFEKRDTGGSCAPACHKPQTYDRNRSAPAATQTQGTAP